MVSEEEKIIIDEEWNSYNRGTYDVFKSGGITREEVAEELKRSSPGMSESDIIWKLYNKKIARAIKKGESGYLPGIYYEMALFLNSSGKDCSHILREFHRATLLNYKDAGVKKVQILSCAKGNSCDHCLELDKKVFAIEEALQLMPLPNKNCSKNFFGTGLPFCRCTFISTTD